jgi:hypothetical protein
VLKQKKWTKRLHKKLGNSKQKRGWKKYQEGFKTHLPQPSKQLKGSLKRNKEPSLIKHSLLPHLRLLLNVSTTILDQDFEPIL